MMLTDLPEEILMIIIEELDVETNHNLYNTCTYFRNIICSYGIIKVCNISLNTLATARTLKLNFFKDISGHIQVLNMCGVPDLCKTSLLSAMNRLKTLKSLNVQYTNITITDLIEIYKLCPTIKDIAVNFVFNNTALYTVPKNIQEQCQNLFENFDCVHFVGSANGLLYSKLALHILHKAKLKKLKFTVTECSYVIHENHDYNGSFQFSQFELFLLNWKIAPHAYYGCLPELPILSKMVFSNFEFIIIFQEDFNVSRVYVSPLFKDFFKINFNLDVESTVDLSNKPLGLNVSVMIWEKKSTIFDDMFFKNILNKVKHFFPFYCSSANNKGPVPKNYDWYYVMVKLDEETECQNEQSAFTFKKSRIALPNSVLNYDLMFKDKDKLQLNLNFLKCNKTTVALTANCDYLKKITFLSLSGFVRYSGEFFNILFRCCCNLITLNVETTSLSSNSSMVTRSIPLSERIKNLRIVDKRIDFKTIFTSLSQCKTLENIHLLDINSSGTINVTNSSILFKNCNYLYNLFIYSSMTDSARTKNLQILNKAKTQCGRHYLNIDLTVHPGHCKYGYDPFVAVFQLNPVKEV